MISNDDIKTLLDIFIEYKCLVRKTINLEQWMMVAKLIASLPSKESRELYCNSISNVFNLDQYAKPVFVNLVDSMRKMMLTNARLKVQEDETNG